MNMKRNLFFYLYICVLFGLFSCGELIEEELVIKEENEKENVIPLMTSNMIRFSEILSKAVKENSELRSFLKTDALKMMDKDYDIFYPSSKNEIVFNGKSFRDILMEYAENEDELTGIEESLSLLTIYVPELPSGFDASTWDAENEIPYVACTMLRNDLVDFYYGGEATLSIKSYEIPGWPTLVVKNNERIRLKNKNITSAFLRSTSYDDTYEFIDEEFNGQTTLMRSVTVPSSQLSSSLISAYNEMGVDNYYWQRDYIYYGLNRQSGLTGTGPLKLNFSKTIVSIKFSPDAYSVMSDQAGDPEKILLLQNSSPNAGHLLWTEGYFEIKLDVYVNNLTGFGTVIEKYFNVHPKDIFDLEYKVATVLPGILYLICCKPKRCYKQRI